MQTSDLKPCPFCGGVAYMSKWVYGYFCGAWHEKDCILNDSVMPDYEYEEKAAEAWNRRANDADAT